MCYCRSRSEAPSPSGCHLISTTTSVKGFVLLYSSVHGKSILSVLNEKESLLIEALHYRKTLSLSDVSRIIEQQKIIPLVKTMIEKGIIVLEEELHQRVKPKTEIFVTLAPGLEEEAQLIPVFEQLEKRAKKQLEILMTYIQMSRYGSGSLLEVKRTDLLKKAGGTSAQLDELVKK
jgi:primosomal protein N' (replication factor Y)